MVTGSLRSLVLLALLSVFATSVHATTCGIPTPEEADLYARQDGFNLLVKGILWGLIVAAYLLNIAWYMVRSQKWILPLVLSVLALPIVLIFWFAELLSQPCGFGGLNAFYYLIPLGALLVIWLVQFSWHSLSDRHPLSIVDEK